MANLNGMVNKDEAVRFPCEGVLGLRCVGSGAAARKALDPFAGGNLEAANIDLAQT
jgi:hypothetical protein